MSKTKDNPTCVVCGNLRPKRNAVACSLKCARYAKELREQGIGPHSKIEYCKQCGKVINRSVKGASQQRFCSSSCAATSNNLVDKGRKRGPTPRPRPYRPYRKDNSSRTTELDLRRKDPIAAQFRLWKYLGTDSSLVSDKDGLLKESIRSLYLQDKGSKCERCGWGEVHSVTGRVPVHVDHKDGNYLNNEYVNLQVLCPNCHSLTSNYGVLNSGKGREYKKEYYHTNKHWRVRS